MPKMEIVLMAILSRFPSMEMAAVYSESFCVILLSIYLVYKYRIFEVSDGTKRLYMGR